MPFLRRSADAPTALKSNSARNRARRAFLIPALEQLEGRLVLTSPLASTTIAGASVGQTLSNVVNNSALGGLTVESTTGFGTQNPPNFLLLGQGGMNFAMVSYISAGASSFTTLSLPAGDGNQVLSSTTTVSQAPRGATAAGPAQPLSGNPFTLNVTAQPNTFAMNGYLYVQAVHGNYIIQYTGDSGSGGTTTFSGCTVVGSFGADR